MNKDEFQSKMLEILDSEYDKSKGSFFYDILKPLAIELEEINRQRQDNIKSFFVGDHKNCASGEILDMKAFEIGLERKKAKKASGYLIIEAKEGCFVQKGEIVTNEDGSLEYEILKSAKFDQNKNLRLKIQAIKEGSEYNIPKNSIKYFKSSVFGIINIKNEEIKGGTNEETDLELKQRYLDYVRNIVVYGNGNYYKKLAKDIDGIKDAIVYEASDTSNLVNVILIDEENTKPDESKIEEVINYIEIYRMPCANIKVEGCKEKALNFNLNLEVKKGVDKNLLKEELKKELKEYLKNMDFKEVQKIRINHISKIILDNENIIDFLDIKMNGECKDIELLEGEVGFLNNLNIN